MNLRPSVIAEFDEVFKKYDVLVMPTLPYGAPKLPTTDMNPKGELLVSGVIDN